MKTIVYSLLNRNGRIFSNSLKDEKGQDLVEYAAVIMLVVLGLTFGMGTLANGINNAMVNVGTAINAFLG
jgi:Flp pilus assembly pilin Flp